MENPFGYTAYDAQRLFAEESDGQADDDVRSPFARDLDRLIYQRAFRRLQGKTQVVTPGEADFFRTRLTHTLEVAQVARRLTQQLNAHALMLRAEAKLDDSWSPGVGDLLTDAGLVDPDVAEAAAILHDLGHPPFGHAGEAALAEGIATLMGDSNFPWDIEAHGSFDGNAQSFRLAVHALTHKKRGNGLELTRAVLDGALKYPRVHGPQVNKWSVFPSEEEAFRHEVRKDVPAALLDATTIEAQIMDWADDVAYSVHDLDDWFHAGFMPIVSLISSSDHVESLSRRICERWAERGKRHSEDEVHGAVRALFQRTEGPFGYMHRALHDGRDVGEPTAWETRESIRQARSALFGEFMGATKIVAREGAEGTPSRRYALQLAIDPLPKLRCDILRELLWVYVVASPRMATHQAGQKRVVRELFEMHAWAACSKKDSAREIFPLDVREDLRGAVDDLQRLRLVVDFVASMTDAYALRSHARLSGRETPFNDFV